jgi:hypothetical protein
MILYKDIEYFGLLQFVILIYERLKYVICFLQFNIGSNKLNTIFIL